MSSIEVLGIPNCSTVKKALRYLDDKGVTYHFRDVRATPLSSDEWRVLAEQDVEGKLVNTRSPSFRKTGANASALDLDTKVAVLSEQPTAMKRPTLVIDGKSVAWGFKEDQFDAVLPS